ncbi:uncharacterized protein LOC128872666 [Hylaeus volcanicus]|uniref:uncharacterized protein LOC128872666 n=1 Tax=Hylaeus volcanicus TaxID=313075 RepID=UPI0023B794D1|nr:uncharacterized protein LOC128872666 [Hylaeus volcanicus]
MMAKTRGLIAKFFRLICFIILTLWVPTSDISLLGTYVTVSSQEVDGFPRHDSWKSSCETIDVPSTEPPHVLSAAVQESQVTRWSASNRPEPSRHEVFEAPCLICAVTALKVQLLRSVASFY